MGLTICKKIVENTGGSINCFSAGAGQGCTFMFSMRMHEVETTLELLDAEGDLRGSDLSSSSHRYNEHKSFEVESLDDKSQAQSKRDDSCVSERALKFGEHDGTIAGDNQDFDISSRMHGQSTIQQEVHEVDSDLSFDLDAQKMLTLIDKEEQLKSQKAK